ncbi:MAG TPA: 2-oxoglutarate dehydrogenase, E2 component, dihydrolipoamide succinyltransferase [Terriglobales bacterium]|jgi:2-oxoglutarate dehydrogenase E2 component (dihydrolipoamide succinyltransferase)|nr:2-oxoglutarate dehydrogenase, E2 component, dihydrolipoamide succinyltransferase [Terriglobales bacterium]
MPTDVIMPQMGESIFEGTLTKWLKKPGDKVQRDEPLFEISTDKVDAEIPAPASGVLKEIKVAEGTTVQVNTVVGVIDAEGAAVVATPPPAPAKAEAPKAAPAPAPAAAKPAAAPPPAARPAPAAAAPAKAVIEFPGEEGGRIRSSPLVRRIAQEHNVNLAQVPGTGLGGRISKQDIMGFLEKHGAGAPAAAPAARPAASTAATAPAVARPAAPAPAPAAIPGELVPMTAMRKKIAERMVESKRTSAHVHSVFEVDMTRIVQLREREKAGFEQRTGSRLTFTTFFCRAAVQALRQVPIVNSSVEGDNIHYHRNINLGVAVSLDWGLIVPVIKNSEEKNFLGLQRAILDLAERARAKKLAPDDVAGGTFTITNPGSYGQMFGLPIIPQPQVAIMGVGSIKKQPVVVTAEDGSDSIAIRSICHLSLGYDHRIVDGAVADQFLALVARYLEEWSEDIG